MNYVKRFGLLCAADVDEKDGADTPGCRNSGENNQRLGSITKAGSAMARWLLAELTHKVLRKDARFVQGYLKKRVRAGHPGPSDEERAVQYGVRR